MALARPLFGVVPVELVDTARVREADKKGDEEELEDVEDHASERDLQRSEVRIDGEHVDDLQRAEDVRGGEEALRYQRRIVGVPLGARRPGRHQADTTLALLLLHLHAAATEKVTALTHVTR